MVHLSRTADTIVVHPMTLASKPDPYLYAGMDKLTARKVGEALIAHAARTGSNATLVDHLLELRKRGF